MLEVNPTNWCALIVSAIFFSLLIRLINSAFRSFDKRDSKKFSDVFKGKDDHWIPFIIGSIEIIGFSLFLKANVAVYIGAWLAFKTANRWFYTPDIKRGLFNRYLLSNGLVLVAAFIAAKYLYA